ncbi:MAG: DUF6527 family protein [Micavibrio sp.]|nr:DUF6527 family protein [Micavibrio sp.]
MEIKIQRVQYMPKELTSGILYVSEEFDIAMHLCACGCGSKIRTPLGVTEWRVEETKDGVTLYPSVGNWQQKCQSHYWIHGGEVLWAEPWSKEKIAAGQKREGQRRQVYYDSMYGSNNTSYVQKVWAWWKSLFD